jgi:hypothetical protein
MLFYIIRRLVGDSTEQILRTAFKELTYANALKHCIIKGMLAEIFYRHIADLFYSHLALRRAKWNVRLVSSLNSRPSVFICFILIPLPLALVLCTRYCTDYRFTLFVVEGILCHTQFNTRQWNEDLHTLLLHLEWLASLCSTGLSL